MNELRDPLREKILTVRTKCEDENRGTNEVLSGIMCPNCEGREMVQVKGRRVCPACQYSEKG